MISRARPLCVLTNAISSSASGAEPAVALEQLGGAEDRLQRIVQLVRDARHEHADRRQALLTDDLALQRLQRLAHLALLLDLMIERVVRFAQVRRHRDERVLQLGELAIGHRRSRGRRQVAAGDLPHGVAHAVHAAAHQRREREREEQHRADRRWRR